MQTKTADCLLRLRAEYANLNPATKKVAEYILNNPGDVIELNIVDLADKIRVSPYSIVNCVKSVGYGGYKDFKISLAQGYDPSRTTLFEGITNTDEPHAILSKTIRRKAQSLVDMERLIDADQLKKSVELIVSADRIETYGIGYSSFAGEMLSMNLRRLGKNTVHFSDPNYQRMSSVMMGPKDVAIGFSTTGASKSVCQALQYTKENGGKTIAVTATAKSLLTQNADVVLITSYSDPMLIKDTISSTVEQVSLVSALTLAVAHIDAPHAIVNMSETSAVIGMDIHPVNEKTASQAAKNKKE